MDDTHVFDDVFKTTAHKLPQLMVPLVNEAFGRNHPLDAEVVQLGEEFRELFGGRTADAVFTIGDSLYHVECESSSDATMPIRMFEYDIAIALERARPHRSPYIVRFPSSCIVYLRGMPESGPERVEVVMPDGQSVAYTSRALDARSYSPERLLEKGLYAIAPFHLLRFEGKEAALEEGAGGERDRLFAECAQLEAGLRANLPIASYDVLLDLYARVQRRVFGGRAGLDREVGEIMNGKILELNVEKIARLERELGEAEEKLDAAEGQLAGTEEKLAGAELQLEVSERQRDRLVELLRDTGVGESEIEAALAQDA